MKIDNKFFNNIGVGNKIKNNDKYIVILQHPVTTEIKSTKLQIDETIKSIKYICEKEKVKALWFWPNVDAGTDIISRKLRSFRENLKPDYITFVKNLSPEKYLKVLFNSQCFIGNSSSGIREGSYLGIPYVNIGNRQKNRERSTNVKEIKIDKKLIIQNLSKIMINKKKFNSSKLYGDGKSSIKIRKILENLDYLNEKKFFVQKK